MPTSACCGRSIATSSECSILRAKILIGDGANWRGIGDVGQRSWQDFPVQRMPPNARDETAVFSLISCFHCTVTALHYGAPPEPHSGWAGMRIIPAPGVLIYASPT
jgi:hypothetical protein